MDDLEQHLGRYRPVGPPRDLRERIAGGKTHAWTVRPWLAAAAALLVAFVMYSQADTERSVALALIDVDDQADSLSIVQPDEIPPEVQP